MAAQAVSDEARRGCASEWTVYTAAPLARLAGRWRHTVSSSSRRLDLGKHFSASGPSSAAGWLDIPRFLPHTSTWSSCSPHHVDWCRCLRPAAEGYGLTVQHQNTQARPSTQAEPSLPLGIPGPGSTPLLHTQLQPEACAVLCIVAPGWTLPVILILILLLLRRDPLRACLVLFPATRSALSSALPTPPTRCLSPRGARVPRPRR